MLPQKLSPNQIYSYLSSRNFNLSSEKSLKQASPNSDTVWSILTFLCQPFPPVQYQQIQPMLVYLLQPETYQAALKRIKQYIMVSTVFSQLQKINKMDNNTTHEYPLKDMLKTDKQIVLQRISALIALNRHHERITEQFQSYAFDQKMLVNTSRQYRRKLDTKQQQIDEIKDLKTRQKSLCEEKIKSIEATNKDSAYKKKQKLDLLNSQQQLKNQLSKKNKIWEQGSYENDDFLLQIKRLQRQIIQNAPKLKKDRMNIMEEYQKCRESAKQKQKYWDEHTNYTLNKLQQIQKIRNKCVTVDIQKLYFKLCKEMENMQKISLLVETDASSKSHKIQEKLTLLSRINSSQKQSKQLHDHHKHGQYNLERGQQNVDRLSRQISRYHGIVVSIQQKIKIQRMHQQQLRDRFRRKKRTYECSMRQKKLVLQSMERQARSIIKQSFKQFIN